MDPRLLNLHLRPELPESGSAELLMEVQQVVAADWHREDECGGTCSRDLDLSSLLERLLCSADGDGPDDGDEGFTAAKSSSDFSSSGSGVTVG